MSLLASRADVLATEEEAKAVDELATWGLCLPTAIPTGILLLRRSLEAGSWELEEVKVASHLVVMDRWWW